MSRRLETQVFGVIGSKSSGFSLCVATASAIFLFSAGLWAEELKPKLNAVIPAGVYADSDGLYDIIVTGENLPPGNRLKLYLNGSEVRPPPTPVDEKPVITQVRSPSSLSPDEKKPATSQEPVGTDQSAKDTAQEPKVYREADSDESQIRLWINRNYYSGLVWIRIGSVAPPATPTPAQSPTISPTPAERISNVAPSATPTAAQSPAISPAPAVRLSNPVSVALAKMDAGASRWLFRGGALLVALLVLWLPVVLVKTSGEGFDVPGVGRWRLVAVFFLDRETATYSLAKFQFYIWSAAAVIAYLYLAGARYFVQGVSDFVDIPGSLPGIVLISASTGALAQVVNTQRGPKGAGEEHPTLADFVSVGGVVSAERVQFFTWTIIGAAIFLWLNIAQDPASIREVPKVPDGFLQLMGISSFGYLAGKLARRPGPVINSVAVEPRPPVEGKPVTITLRGRILSADADFKISYKEQADGPETEVALTPDRLDPTEPVKGEELDEQSKPDKTYKKLTIKVMKADPKWFLDGKIVISNPDGQAASWPLPKG